jgi:hypothetical protein
MPRSLLASYSLAAAAGALACSSPSSPTAACVPTPGAYAPGVVVGIADSVTGRPLADTATGTVQSTAVSDSLRHGVFPPLDSILVGNVGPGTYTVTVVRAGYVSWVRAHVVVAADACGAGVTENLTARLRPAP